jgi:glycosyltransferase involved in cell wall biosynthesis
MNSSSIAIFTWGLCGDAIENAVAALCWGLWKLGYHNLSIVYLFEEAGPFLSLPPSVKLVPLGVTRSLSSPYALASFLKTVKPDYLIAMATIINFPAIFGWRLAGRVPTKLVISEHSTMSYKAQVEFKADPRMRLLPWLSRTFYPWACGLHANSPEVLDDLLQTIGVPIPPERTVAIGNAVNIEAIATYSQLEPEHPWLQNKQKPVLLSAGRLARQKNFPLLLQAFADVRKSLDARLIILGEGPERPALQQQIQRLNLESVVSLPGFTYNPWSAMARADAFILPSEEEPFGLVLVEAMACGLPIIATDAISSGPRSILDNGKYGVLVPRSQQEALTTGILEVMSSDSLRHQLSTAGKERCQDYRPEKIANQWLSFLEALPPRVPTIKTD